MQPETLLCWEAAEKSCRETQTPSWGFTFCRLAFYYTPRESRNGSSQTPFLSHLQTASKRDLPPSVPTQEHPCRWIQSMLAAEPLIFSHLPTKHPSNTPPSISKPNPTACHQHSRNHYPELQQTGFYPDVFVMFCRMNITWVHTTAIVPNFITTTDIPSSPPVFVTLLLNTRQWPSLQANFSHLLYTNIYLSNSRRD